MAKKKPTNLKFQGSNWRCLGLLYTYEEHCNCNCGDDDYCRCGTITNARVTDVNLATIHHALIENRKLTEVESYCVDRILVAYQLYDVNVWNVNVTSGYYGEEIKSITLDSQIATKCDQDIEAMLALLSNAEKIEFVLNLEYGYLLAILAGKRYKIITVEKKDLSFQTGHYHRLNRDIVSGYKDYSLPRGIVIKQENQYRLIDGYHRCAAADGKIKVLLAY
jgi:hypothetical protein